MQGIEIGCIRLLRCGLSRKRLEKEKTSREAAHAERLAAGAESQLGKGGIFGGFCRVSDSEKERQAARARTPSGLQQEQKNSLVRVGSLAVLSRRRLRK